MIAMAHCAPPAPPAPLPACEGVVNGAGCCKVVQTWLRMGGSATAFKDITQDKPDSCCGVNGVTCDGTKIIGINWADKKGLNWKYFSIPDFKYLQAL